MRMLPASTLMEHLHAHVMVDMMVMDLHVTVSTIMYILLKHGTTVINFCTLIGLILLNVLRH